MKPHMDVCDVVMVGDEEQGKAVMGEMLGRTSGGG